jgi:hypothetical protein
MAPDSDPLISRTEEAAAERSAMEAANLFDLRRIIGGLFAVLGLLLVLLGLFESQAEIDKAAGVNINLWAGLGMIMVGVFFLIWAFTRPLGAQLREAEEGEGAGPSYAAPPRGVDAAALASQESRRRTGRDRERPSGSGGAGSQ